jgi:trehalose monomycolate/heme transporter
MPVHADASAAAVSREPLLARTTRRVLRYRGLVIVLWLVVLVAGGVASTRLSALLSNGFAVPGTESYQAEVLLQRHFGDQSDGEFLIVFDVANTRERLLRTRLQARVDRAVRAIPTAHAGRVQIAGRHVLYADLVSQLDLAHAKRETGRLLGALGQTRGVRASVTGQAAIQHDLDPVFHQDLRRGELEIAIPAALIVLLLVLGLSAIVSLPLLFAAATIAGTLGLVFVIAHLTTMATYVTNLVELIGLALAVDYSLLVVYRFREELTRGDRPDEAIVRTMMTAGRSVVFSGVTVTLGLALLLFIPVPFVRSLGIGGFLIPLVSIAAAVTLLPALLSFYGRRGSMRIEIARGLRGRLGLPAQGLPATNRRGSNFWERLAHSIMRRPFVYLAGAAATLVLAASPVFALSLTPGSADGVPRSLQSVQAYGLLRGALGAGALSPTQLVIDSGRTGGAAGVAEQRATTRLTTELEADPEVVAVQPARGTPLVDPTSRYQELVVIGRHEYGQEAAQKFVGRLRHTIVPGARFPAASRVLVGGGPAQGVDFLQRSYRAFPWLVLAVLALTYLLLLHVFRSLLLPLKAVLLNLLSVSASYGMLVVFFRWGLGAQLFGLYRSSQIEGWIPIFLFALLFGLSMDYEVFLVTRMREAWDKHADNKQAVADGLERTGRIITAAAIVMVAAFSGFIAGRIEGLQEFGLGLAVAIFLDATIVRALLVPSLMAVLGHWNWWLPKPIARAVHAEPSLRQLDPSCYVANAAFTTTSHEAKARLFRFIQRKG